MATTTAGTPIATERFPIFKLAHRYILYDVDTVSHIRQHHNICGVLIGGLPQAPQQNVFMGLPVELTPEDARLLVEKKVAYVLDDAKAHRRGVLENGLSIDERRAYQAALRKQGLSAAREADRKTSDKKKAAMKRKLGTDNWNDIPADMLEPGSKQEKQDTTPETESRSGKGAAEDDESLFASPVDTSALESRESRGVPDARIDGPEPYAVTPTTSYPPLHAVAPQPTDGHELPAATQAYPLFKHLHEEGYFLTPGLRFGCQFVAYPGDPLRFHSHFLCNGMDWDQEFGLLDLVGGGRLGTGVKKGFLIGGEDNASTSSSEEGDSNVRTFCIEWGGM